MKNVSVIPIQLHFKNAPKKVEATYFVKRYSGSKIMLIIKVENLTLKYQKLLKQNKRQNKCSNQYLDGKQSILTTKM